MKKLIYCVAALATMIFAGSCQQEIFEPAAKSNTVTYTVEAPADVLTKTIGNGLNVTELIYEVWHTSADGTIDLTGAKKLYQDSERMEVVNGVNRTVITLDLLADQHYTILFWAQVAGTGVYNTNELTAVTYNDLTAEAYAANDERLAAFYSVDFINDGVARNSTVTLLRPFAQVNLGTLNSKSEAKENDYKIDLKKSRMILDAVPTVFNTATSVATDYKKMTFAYHDVPALTAGDETITVGETDYQYAGMNYVFAGEPVRLTYDIKVSLNGSEDWATVNNTIENVPVARNYRTNIVGNLLTSKTEYEVVVDERFNQPDPDINVEILDDVPTQIDLEDGKSVVIPDLSDNHTVVVYGKGSIELQGTSIISADEAAIVLEEGAEVTLIITDEVKIEGETAGVVVSEGAVLNIVGSEEVVTKSSVSANNLIVIGKAGSGIDGSVTIENVAHVTAIGNGSNAYGIGAANADVVIINSTIDYACGGFGGENAPVIDINADKYLKATPEGAPAIGGKKIVINGSIVTKADGGSKAAAIGARYWNSTEIEIVNSTILEANGGNASAGIGGSRYSDDISADNKQESRIKIENSTVNATGGYYAAGIGAGYDTHCAANETTAVNDIVIINSTVNAQGGMYAAGIGTGYHSAALTGSIDAASTINAVSGEKYYKDTYTEAQNIGYGVVDLDREAKDLSVTFTVAGKTISAPTASYIVSDNEVLIGSATGLKKFADNINSGNDYYAGKTVKLTSDIDLNNEEWTPIGSATQDHGFMGNFDGNGYTIKNLKMTELTADADGYVYAGLFGITEGTETQENYIKNLVIENVTIETAGHIAAAAIAYPYYTTVENVTVKGNVNIKGGDYTSGVLAYTRRCVNAKNIAIVGNQGSSIEGGITVGGVISDIQMNGGLTANYSNFSASGLTIKGAMHVGGISGIICLQTLNGAIVENVAIVSDDVRKGALVGSLGDNSVITGASVNNVTGAANWVGATYKDGSTCSVTINGVVYTYLNGYYKTDEKSFVSTADGLVAALEANEDVVFMNDIKIDPANMSNAYGKTGINVKNGQTIEGNGHTLNIKGAGGTWDSGICTSGGLIKNLWVTGSFRGIFVKGAEHTEKVVLENVRVEGTTYTISIDQASGQGLEATNSIFRGWTSYAATIGEVKFDGCTFGAGNGNNFSRPFAVTEYVNCNFEEGHKMDPRAEVTFENCTLNGVALTAENLSTLVISNIANASVK